MEEGVSKVRDTLFLFRYLMEPRTHPSTEKGLHHRSPLFRV